MSNLDARPRVLVYSNGEIIGDGLIKLPAVSALRYAFPAHRLTWMAGRGSSIYTGALKPLVEDLVDELADHAGVGLSLRELAGTRPFGDKCFDIIIDTQQSLRTTLILKRARPRVLVSWAGGGLLSNRHLPVKPVSMLDRIMALVSVAAGRDVAPVFELRIPKSYRDAARLLLPDGPVYVGIAPGAGGGNKRWPFDRFVELGLRQARAGRCPVFFLGPEEQHWVNDLRSAVPGALFPELSLPADLPGGPILCIALAERIRLGIANDSGVGHLLAAGGRPLISLFGPTNAQKFLSFGGTRIVIRAQDFGGHEMADIPLNAVVDAAEGALAAGR